MPETMRLSVQGQTEARERERNGSLVRRSGRRRSQWIRTWVCGVSMLVAAACGTREEVAQHAADDQEDAAVRLSRYLAGLDETVTLLKEGFSSYAIRADGSIASVQELYEEEKAAYRVRFGAMTQGLHARVRTSDRRTRLRVAVYFDEAVPGGPTASMLRSPDPAARETGRAGAEASIAAARRALEPMLLRAGFRATSEGRYIPAVFGTVAAGQVEVIARDPRVRLVASDEPARPIEFATDPIGFHDIDSVFNGAGMYANGQRYGVLEAGQNEDDNPCRIYDGHEAFAFNAAPVTYQTTGTLECSSDSDCLSLCDTCVDGFCVTDHGSQVASVTSHSQGSPYGAAEIEVFFPNSQPVCSLSGIADSYDWLIANDVYTTNESYGCDTGPFGIVDGSTQDYYARRYGLTVVKAAGNSGPEGVACPTTLNSLCVGGTSSSHDMSCFSSSNNPEESDREEPDLTALAGDGDSRCGAAVDFVEVMGFSGPSDWSGENLGTSFAAPAVAAIVMHLKESCELQGTFGFMDEKLIRAILRTASWVENPETPERYATPALADDYADGGGWLSAAAAEAFCRPGDGTDSGLVDIDLENGEPMPDGEPTYEPGTPREEDRGRGRSDGIGRIENPILTPPGPGDGRVQSTFYRLDLRPGDRVRTTISWDSCALDPLSDTITAVAVDLDVFAYNSTTQQYIYGSQSVDDSNEGFDITIQESDGEGEYWFMAAWPEGMPGCDGATHEGMAWALAWWK